MLHTSVEFASRQDNHPDVGHGILLGKQIADVHSQGAIEEDCQEFKADDAL